MPPGKALPQAVAVSRHHKPSSRGQRRPWCADPRAGFASFRSLIALVGSMHTRAGRTARGASTTGRRRAGLWSTPASGAERAQSAALVERFRGTYGSAPFVNAHGAERGVTRLACTGLRSRGGHNGVPPWIVASSVPRRPRVRVYSSWAPVVYGGAIVRTPPHACRHRHAAARTSTAGAPSCPRRSGA